MNEGSGTADREGTGGPRGHVAIVVREAVPAPPLQQEGHDEGFSVAELAPPRGRERGHHVTVVRRVLQLNRVTELVGNRGGARHFHLAIDYPPAGDLARLQPDLGVGSDSSV